MIGRRAGRLDDVNILTADVFVDFNEGFTIRKSRYRNIGEVAFQIGRDPIRQCRVSSPGKEFHAEVSIHA